MGHSRPAPNDLLMSTRATGELLARGAAGRECSLGRRGGDCKTGSTGRLLHSLHKRPVTQVSPARCVTLCWWALDIVYFFFFLNRAARARWRRSWIDADVMLPSRSTSLNTERPKSLGVAESHPHNSPLLRALWKELFIIASSSQASAMWRWY